MQRYEAMQRYETLDVDATTQPVRAYSASIASGSTITNFPIDPLSRNLMRPVILAKSVSSLPRPTFSPGFTRVPRWRTMIVPPGTSCPPKALNPSRCAFESRPFREVPCPFLCAINQFPVLSGQLPVNSKSLAVRIHLSCKTKLYPDPDLVEGE